MKVLRNILDGDKSWIATIKAADRVIFNNLSRPQGMENFWAGCAGRFPVNEIVSLNTENGKLPRLCKLIAMARRSMPALPKLTNSPESHRIIQPQAGGRWQ